MSMSEFEGLPTGSDSEPDSFCLSLHSGCFPEDFSEADIAFAQEMDALFSLDDENLPPLFVQTLLDSENPTFFPVETAFEKKTYARVFRRLKLKRSLFRSRGRSYPFSLSRPVFSIGIVCAVFMLLTVAMTSPAFASGLNYLWSGAHSGVLLVDRYPGISHTSAPHASHARENSTHTLDASDADLLTLASAQKLLHFTLSWPQYIPSNYTQNDVFLYKGDPSWADGPIAVVNFYDSRPGTSPRQISICEFKPQGQVLQVVQNGAAHQITIGSGVSSAVYVQGEWTPSSLSTPTWVYSYRSQLIYEDARGVVFWIVGDQRDGVDQSALKSIASSLAPYGVNRYAHVNGHVSRVMESDDNTPLILANDVIYLDNPDNRGGPSFKLVGSDQSPSALSHLHAYQIVSSQP